MFCGFNTYLISPAFNNTPFRVSKFFNILCNFTPVIFLIVISFLFLLKSFTKPISIYLFLIDGINEAIFPRLVSLIVSTTSFNEPFVIFSVDFDFTKTLKFS